MTPRNDDENIDIHAKSDHELLIIIVGKLNTSCQETHKCTDVLFNNGWGLVAQNKVMWACFMALGGILLKLAVK